MEKRTKRERVKVTFETINQGRYSVIPGAVIAKANDRIKKAMRKFDQERRVREKRR